MNKIVAVLFFLSVFIFLSFHPGAQPQKRPNILLILADDLGYTDLGCYGGEIKTPNIDQLAASGLQFTNFHVSSLCAPTRSMLLTGNDNHVAGMGSMFSVKGTPREGKTGYEGYLTDRIVPFAQLLKDAGYQTYMSGKWHLGFANEHIPYVKGFEKSFTLLNGGANHFNNHPIFFNTPPSYRENNEVVLFPDGKFSTEVFTEKMMGYIRDGEKGEPFFAYLAYTAPHWPLQVPAEYLDMYRGQYDIGYDSLRVIRFNRQKELGIIPAHVQLPPRNPEIKLWSELSSDEKRIEARKMELYAAMVDHLDKSVGQMIRFLKETGEFDNTIIVFMSDNGAAAEDFYNVGRFSPFLKEHYDNSYQNMGKPSSFVSYGPQWAQASAAPFKLFKYYFTEGGILAPLIIAGKLVNKNPGIQNVFINVMDLAPSFLEIAQTSYPEKYNNKKVAPVMGESFLPFIMGKDRKVHDDNYSFGMEHDGQCMLIKGEWKITNISDPFDEEAFGLYNLRHDPGETTDLRELQPGKYREMMREWKKFKKRTGVISKEKGIEDSGVR